MVAGDADLMKRLLAIALIVSACGGTVETPSLAPTAAALSVANLTTAAPTASPTPTAAAPTAAPTPSPTPNPEAVRKTAAAAYLVVAETSNKAFAALGKKYKTFGTLARARAYFKAASKIDGAFTAALRKIVVPADTAGDLHSLIVKTTADQALDIEGSGVKSWAAVDSVNAALLKSDRNSTAAANLIRSDLGLPPVHL